MLEKKNLKSKASTLRNWKKSIWKQSRKKINTENPWQTITDKQQRILIKSKAGSSKDTNLSTNKRKIKKPK